MSDWEEDPEVPEDPLLDWQGVVKGLGQVSISPPKWVVPNFLPPGLSIIASDPKVGKTTLTLAVINVLLNGATLNADDHSGTVIGPVPNGGTVFYVPYEQSDGRLRHMYETRVARRTHPPSYAKFLFPEEPWSWQVDKPTIHENYEQFMKAVKPSVTVIDPWIYAHSGDENDPSSIRPLVPLKNLAEKLGLSVVVIHHNSKRSDVEGFGKVRGTSALWGMADAGHLVSRDPRIPGKLMIKSEFKDWEAKEWSWRLP